MPKNRTSFRRDWLKQKDSNGHLLEDWCKQTNSKFIVLCKFCNRSIRCDNRGCSQLLNHAASEAHIKIIEGIMKGTQLRIQTPVHDSIASAASTQTAALTCWSNHDSTIKAELLWALKVASSNYSFNSSKNMKELFQSMFPDSIIASKFAVGPSKLSHLISEATGPYFHDLLLHDLKNSASPFTLMYDELSNKQVKKQLDIKIRYWSTEHGEVRVHHLNTYLMGRATGKDIASSIMKAVDDNKLQLKDLIMLGSDGPNVNKTVFSIVTEAKKALDLPALANMGTCSLHVVHGAFGKGLKFFGQEAVDLIIDLHNFLKLSPVRMEEFRSVQDNLMLSQLKILKHVQCRWLTLGPAIERVISQWSALEQYFLKELPKRDPKISENVRFTRIWNCINVKSRKLLVQLHFLLSVCKLLQPYLALFQREEPLIHILFEEMTKLTKVLLGRFMKIDALKGKTLIDLQLLSLPNVKAELNDDEMEIGNDAWQALQKLTPGEKKIVLHGMRTFYHQLASYLLQKLPGSDIIKESRCLKPEHRCQSWTVQAIKSLSAAVPLFPAARSEIVADEWKILQCEDIDPEWYTTKDEEKTKNKRIDHYWVKIFSMKDAFGQNKYPELTKLVKAILVMSHGNADPERGFSQVGNFLTESRTLLSQSAISALQSTKDGLKQYDYQCHKVPITNEFLRKGRNAQRSYVARLEEEKQKQVELQKAREKEKEECKKRKAEQDEQQKALDEKSKEARHCIMKEKALETQEIHSQTELDACTTLVQEANERIKEALKRNDMKGARIGQTILEAAHKKMDDAHAALHKIREEQKLVERNKRTVLAYFCKGNDLKKAKKQ